MTTLAYRDRVLAADGRMMVAGWVMPVAVAKLRRLGDGRLAGFTGDCCEFLPFLAWLERGGVRPDLGEAARIVVVGSDGGLTVHEGGGSFELAEPFMAWGSGAPAALAAMHAGADARRAVEIATLLDPDSGGPVSALQLDPMTAEEAEDFADGAKLRW